MAENLSVIRPQGRLDSSTSGEFEQGLLKRIEDGNLLLVIDLSNVAFISSAGLRVLLSVAKQVKAAGGKLVVCSLNTYVKQVFDVTGCTTLLDVFPTFDAAAAHLTMR
jgi:anti-anti-sigma factor